MIRDDAEARFVESLRQEASELKDCFTRFTFQASAGAVAWLSLVATGGSPWIALGSLPVAAVLMLVCRIGIYKYSTANRNYGYELHLARTRDVHGPAKLGAWSHEMRDVRWEEALRAWRVVQAAAFAELYRTPTHRIAGFWDSFRRTWEAFSWTLYGYSERASEIIDNRTETSYPWFSIVALTHSVYHPGTYLRNMVGAMHWLQCGVSIPLYVAVFRLPPSRAWIPFVAWIALVLGIYFRDLRVRRRTTVLESELLSIHSCAILWQAVILAHYRAYSSSAAYQTGHYTERLTKEAEHLVEHIDDVHGWVRGDYF